MPNFNIKPTHKRIKQYYAELQEYDNIGAAHEGAVRTAFQTISAIPKKGSNYRLRNRSALEWIINQYCVKIDKRSGIVNDPNRADDPQYIVKLIGKVITVSLETVKVVERLPALDLE